MSGLSPSHQYFYQYLYPALNTPPTTLTFHDEYAFRPNGSTTAAVITLLQTVRASEHKSLRYCLCT